MISFKPTHILSLEAELKNRFPLPRDFALRDADSAQVVLHRIRSGPGDFQTMSISDFQFVFQISTLCSDDEYTRLLSAFRKRVTPQLFETGWLFYQLNSNNTRATGLFTAACEWMRQNHPLIYNKTLPGRAGLPWSQLYLHAVDILNGERLSFDDFCKIFDILTNTLFYSQLLLTYLSRCQKEQLKKNEEALSALILTSKLEFLRPALENYTAKFTFDEISPVILESIAGRLHKEPDNVSLGLSPAMLQRIRQRQFDDILEEYTLHNDAKLNVYRFVVGKLKKIHTLDSGFFSLDFGSYIVLDNRDWKGHAYVYSSTLYTQFLDEWIRRGEPEDYWPGIDTQEIINARDAILGLHKSGVIKISFNGFDMLYARDILSNPRAIV